MPCPRLTDFALLSCFCINCIVSITIQYLYKYSNCQFTGNTFMMYVIFKKYLQAYDSMSGTSIISFAQPISKFN